MDTIVAFTSEYSKGINSKGTCVYYGPRTHPDKRQGQRGFLKIVL
jgi:hypothetical protein